jgi:hypothetical protein
MRFALPAAAATVLALGGLTATRAAAQPGPRTSVCFVGVPVLVMGCPLARDARLIGTLTYDFLTPDSFLKRISVPLTIGVRFTPDFTGVRVISGWPKTVLDDSAPLSPATDGVTITLANGAPGRYEPATGHMVLPVTLHLDYLRDYQLGSRDQDVLVELSTRGVVRTGAPGMRLWESPPAMGFGGETRFSTREFFFSGTRGHTLSVILSGNLNPLPPRP